MNITPHILLSSGRLKPYAKQIKEGIDEVIKKIETKVSISDVDVVIYDNPFGVIQEIGVGGYTPDAYTIFLSLDPSFSAFEKTVTKELGRTFTHEMHHILRWRDPGYGNTLLDALIAEGLADHFDLEINNEDVEPWCKALRAAQLVDMLERAKNEFDNSNYDHSAWFFGSEEKNIPKWTGYSLGFNIVDNYLKNNPDKKPSTIYSLKTKEFII